MAMSSETDDHSTFAAQGAGLGGGKTEVEAVAGVVFDNEEAPGFAGHSEDSFQDCVDARRGENLAADGRGEHAIADETGMSRLVPTAAAGDDCHFLNGPSPPHNDFDGRIAVETRELSFSEHDGRVDRLGDDITAIIDEMFHNVVWIQVAQGKIALVPVAQPNLIYLLAELGISNAKTGCADTTSFVSFYAAGI